jgi:hypothetical protein
MNCPSILCERRPFWLLVALFLCGSHVVLAQKRAFVINIGADYGINLTEKGPPLRSKAAMCIGLDYWGKNRRGNHWIAGVTYNIVRQAGETVVAGRTEDVKERFDYVQLRFSPLVWWLGGHKKVFAAAGIFANYLAQQETQVGTGFTDNKSLIKRTQTGITGSLGYKLGKEGDRNSLYVGLRNDYAALSFGKASADMRFNVISAFVGLGF